MNPGGPSNSPRVDAVAAGHICLDIIPDLSQTTAAQFRQGFGPGRLTQVGAAAFSTGGPVSNVGLALHKLGVRTQLMGKVGDDLFGEAILRLLAAREPGLEAGMIVDAAASTSYTVVINPPGIDRFFLHSPGANDTFAAGDIRYERLESARLFHFGYPPLMHLMYAEQGDQLAETFRRARATGITTSLDMAYPDPASEAGQAPWPAILAAALPYVDIFLPSIEEILFMLRRPILRKLEEQAEGGDILPLVSPDLLADVACQLLDMGARVVGLKLGHRGLYVRTGGAAAMAGMGRAAPADVIAWADKELWAPCFCAHLVGAAGSGDATIAGFLAGLLAGLSAEQTAIAAVAVGGCNVEAVDTLSGLRTWGETMARVAAGWEQHVIDLAPYGWTYDASSRLWARRVPY